MSRIDVYQTVTDAVIEALEEGVRPWQQPWSGPNGAPAGGIPLRHCGTPYRGINILILWMRAAAKGWTSRHWFTYRQASSLGAQVRRGEAAARIVYYGTLTKNCDDENNAETEEQTIRFAKSFSVFNAEQIDGLPENYVQTDEQLYNDTTRIAELDAWIAATLADIRHGGNNAFYTISDDYIQMPNFERFPDPQLYYSTLAHELTHWTRHSRRLDRDLGSTGFGSPGYAKEELVAELASAFLGAEWGFRPDHIDDHAAYIRNWLTALRSDKRVIFRAAAHAQRAADYLLDLGQMSAEKKNLVA